MSELIQHLPTSWRQALVKLFPRWFKPLDRTAFSQAGVMDRRTIMLPMIGDQQSKSYYDVAEMWARERLRAKKHLQEILGGQTDYGDPDHAASSFACEVGIWLRFVDVPGMAETLDDLRMWHDHWHQELARLIDLANEGQRGPVEDAMRPGRGSWSYAARRVNYLLESLWEQKVPVGLQLRLDDMPAGEWIDAALLHETAPGAALTLSLETRLDAGASVVLRDATKPEAQERRYRVKLCRPGQRGRQDQGVFIAYLVP
ncbi:hypothetical protein GALL_211280 [mine drainage metagenome]|uniref:Uncharacterized protein n=1 Tax=mine drainage metagenome TaxID=410659 RepID=A0A1J5RMM2_9ZZZZ